MQKGKITSRWLMATHGNGNGQNKRREMEALTPALLARVNFGLSHPSKSGIRYNLESQLRWGRVSKGFRNE